MTAGTTITYLRKGRQKRATGKVVDFGAKQLVKVKPDHLDWKHVWLTPQEIAAGKEKPPIQPREKPATPSEKPKRVRKPKAPPLPRWKQLVDTVYAANADSRLFPGITMNLVVELADELVAAHQTLFKP